MLTLNAFALYRGNKCIVQNANLSIFPGEKIGLVGPNGVGKSSLLAALQGQLQADQGNINLPPHWRMAAIDQEVLEQNASVLGFALTGNPQLHHVLSDLGLLDDQANPNADVARLYQDLEELNGYRAKANMASILHGLGFKAADLGRPVREFSGGWKMRMNLAKVLGSEADLMILDEPTNHLDLDAVLWLSGWLQKLQSTVIVVSHDRDFLDDVCSHIVHIHQQTLNKYTGGYTQFERTFAERAANIEASNRKSSQEAQRLQQFIDRFKAKASKAKQAQSRVKRLEKIQALQSMGAAQHDIELNFLPPLHSPDPLISLRDAHCGYQVGQAVLSKVQLDIRPGDRIGLLGANGQGKTTLVRSLLGDLPLLMGTRTEGKGLVVGYFAQDQIESLRPEESPLQHLRRTDPKASEQTLRKFAAQFYFRDEQALQPVGNFSGGEKSRLALALLAYQRPNLLLLDEPTNHLDMATRQALADALLSYGGALVVVSHDRHLLESCCDAFYRAHANQLNPIDGDLEDYAKLLRQEAQAERKNTESSATEQTKANEQLASSSCKYSHTELKALRAQLRQLEKQAETYQAELKACDTKLENLDYKNPQSHHDAQLAKEARQTAWQKLQTAEEDMLSILLKLE